MFSRKIFYIFVFGLMFTPIFHSFGAVFQFQQDLKYGDTSSDVVVLQKVLNLSSDTTISVSGPGSKGNETSYFGSLTKAAVIRFQNKYKDEVLTPAGLTSGTGFVGPLTRKKLNQIIVGLNNASTSTTQQTTQTQTSTQTSSTNYSTSSSVESSNASSSDLVTVATSTTDAFWADFYKNSGTNASQYNYSDYAANNPKSSSSGNSSSGSGGSSSGSNSKSSSDSSQSSGLDSDKQKKLISLLLSAGDPIIAYGILQTMEKFGELTGSGGDSSSGGGSSGLGSLGGLLGGGSSSGSGGTSGGTSAGGSTGSGSSGGGGQNDYYGGKINKVTYCTCYYDPAVIVEVKDLASNQTIKVKYSPWQSRLRADYNIWSSGGCVIGGYTRGSAECKNTSNYTCTNSGTTGDGTIDWIRGIGSTQNSSCNTSTGGN